MPYFLSPIGNDQQVDTNGNPLSGGKIYTYLAGTSTPATTYTSNLGTVAQANPVVLNSLGRPASPIWMEGDIALKFVITNSADVVQATFDNIVGLNDPQEAFTEWVASGLTPTYISATSFSVVGNQTADLQANRRIQYVLNSGTYYGYIFSASFGSGVTTVVVAPDSTNLDATLSSFKYGFVSATNTSIPQQFVLAAADKVPARANPATIRKLLSNNGTDSGWYTLSVVQQIITATGTYTPTAGMVHCVVEMVGGGAGGYQASSGNFGGGGGGAGEYAFGSFTAADIGASKSATIGAGGAVTTAGGTTSLGTLLTAVGGAVATNVYKGGLGGTGGTGTGLHTPGGDGATGSGIYSGPVLMGGSGGASFYGGGGAGGVGNLDHGFAGRAYGAGGGGNGNTGGTWGDAGVGKAGVIVITEFVLTAV